MIQVREEAQRLVKEDIAVIDSSLQFINELLRNMLDVSQQCAASIVFREALVEGECCLTFWLILILTDSFVVVCCLD